MVGLKFLLLSFNQNKTNGFFSAVSGVVKKDSWRGFNESLVGFRSFQKFFHFMMQNKARDSRECSLVLFKPLLGFVNPKGF